MEDPVVSLLYLQGVLEKKRKEKETHKYMKVEKSFKFIIQIYSFYNDHS